MENLIKQKPTIRWKEKLDEDGSVFTPHLISKSDKILDTFLHNLSKAKETSEIWKAVEIVVKGFDKLNMQDDGFIGAAEREELTAFIKYAAEIYGLKYEGDLTEEFRSEW